MKSILDLLETYFMVLVHPFRIHQQFRYNVALPGQENHFFVPLKLSEALGISWVFAIVRGLGKLVLMNFFLQSFISMQSDKFPILQDLILSSGLSTYYFLLFSASLDIIFFPITALVMTEVWAWMIRTYSKWLNPDLPHEEIADQITTHALSSNIFCIVPFLGDMIQTGLYYFLLYAGLRSNLGTSRSLAWVILITPTLIAFMLFSLFALLLFFLFS
ncbi:MAG: hypothetical protein H0V66_04665 [Bdellovibrionales bacterium]|nr:hypothetical protein [Bdellovibrionales bacterium]